MIDEDAPIVFSEGEVVSKYGAVKKQIRMDLGRKGLFANGLTAKNGISWSGNNVSVDSYNSDNGDYDLYTNRNDQGSVASVSISAGAVSPGNGNIYGYVATGGGDPSFGPNGSLTGKDTPAGTKIDQNRIAKDFYADFEYYDAPNMTGANTSIPASGTIGNPSATTPS